MGSSSSKVVAVDMTDKVVIVTGAASGIGYVAARELARYVEFLFFSILDIS